MVVSLTCTDKQQWDTCSEPRRSRIKNGALSSKPSNPPPAHICGAPPPPQLAPHLRARPLPVQACGDAGEEGGQVVLRVLLAHAVVWPVAKHEEVGREFDVLAALRPKALGVKLLGVLVPLQRHHVSDRAQGALQLHKLALQEGPPCSTLVP